MLFIKDIIKLDSQGLSLQDIAQRLESSKSSVKRYLDRARTLGMDWSTAKPMTESEIRALFVKQREIDIGTYLPDWEAVYSFQRQKRANAKRFVARLPQYRPGKQRRTHILNILSSFQCF